MTAPPSPIPLAERLRAHYGEIDSWQGDDAQGYDVAINLLIDSADLHLEAAAALTDLTARAERAEKENSNAHELLHDCVAVARGTCEADLRTLTLRERIHDVFDDLDAALARADQAEQERETLRQVQVYTAQRLGEAEAALAGLRALAEKWRKQNQWGDRRRADQLAQFLAPWETP